MKQHDVVEDTTAAIYVEGVEQVWASWGPALKRGERLLRGTAWRGAISAEECADELRRTQYRAHAASEIAAGLQAPPIAAGAHARLLASLGAARDTLGVLAVRAELGDIEQDEAAIGMHALAMTRDAFSSARDRIDAVEPWGAPQSHEIGWSDDGPDPSRGVTVLLWGLVAVCVVLFTVLLFEVFLLAPVGG